VPRRSFGSRAGVLRWSMPRSVTSAFIAAMGAPLVYPCLFLEIYFAAGPVRMCTAYQDKILNSVVFKGVGNFLDVSTIEDGSTVTARGLSVSLSGIDPSLLAETLTQFQVGMSATITLALLASEVNDLPVNSPVVAWKGRTDEPTITISGQSATITVALESILLDMNTPLAWRYTPQDQKLFYPHDQGFDFVNAIQNLPIYWSQVESNNGTP
jgi:hypothetical protein